MNGWAPVGAVFERPAARAAALAYGVAMVGLDYGLVHHGGRYFPRPLLAAVALLVAATLLARDPRAAASLGWRRLPDDERRAWRRGLAWATALVVVGIAALAALAAARGRSPFPLHHLAAADAVWLIVVWPLHEECIYRVALLPGAVAALGRWGGGALGVAAFAGLHVVYGNFDPSNATGSLVLTFAFVRSGSLLLTVGLHAAGNAAIFALHALVAQVT